MIKLVTPYCSDFSKSNVIIKHFPDTESYVLIPQIDKLKNKKVTIYHRLYPEPEKRIFELLLILSRIKKETKNIELFVPYLPYARQDRECRIGEVVSADVLCELLKNYGVKKLITYDCHFLPKAGKFTRNGLKIENKSASKQLYAYAKKYFKKENFTVIAPDEGSSYFIENAKGADSHSLIKTRKRNKDHGLETEIDSMKSNGVKDLNGKNTLILDDMIATGGTIVHATKHLKSLGAKKIIVGATHGVFAGDPPERLGSSIRAGKIPQKILKTGARKIFVTNSIRQQNSLLGILFIK